MNKKLIKTLIDEFGIYNKDILSAFKEINREDFVPEVYKDIANTNVSIPLVNGQTSTKPSTIARFLNLISLKEDWIVYEFGTGSGYQTAILSLLYKKVISYEIDEMLFLWASARLKKYDNVEVINEDPLKQKLTKKVNSIIFSFATHRVPNYIVELLMNNGSIIAPILKGKNQILLHISKKNGKINKFYLNYENFVTIRGIADDE